MPWPHGAINPIGNSLGDLGLFTGIHVIAIFYHGCVHSNRTAPLTLYRRFEQFQVFLISHISPGPEEGKQWTIDARNARVRVFCLHSEKVFSVLLSARDVQECGCAYVGRKIALRITYQCISFTGGHQTLGFRELIGVRPPCLSANCAGSQNDSHHP